MVSEALEILGGTPGLFIDCTLGRGGYTRGILERHPLNKVIAIDRDPDAIAWAQNVLLPRYPDRLWVVHDRFSNIQNIWQAHGSPLDVAGIVFDLGVSSPQLDVGERGFSFTHLGPLHMGMGLNDRSVENFLNTAEENEIAHVIRTFGEEKRAKKIAAQLVRHRTQHPLTTTQDLAAAVLRVQGPDGSGLHPATRTFQALRIWVNRELEELQEALQGCLSVLQPSSRLVVVSFHALEDRIVKQFFHAQGRIPAAPNRHLPLSRLSPPPPRALHIPGKQPLLPLPEERRLNPRSRSARLRYAVKTSEETLG